MFLPGPTKFHGVTENHNLFPHEYENCLEIMRRGQEVFKDWVGYVESKGMNPSIFLPNGEWKDIINPSVTAMDQSYAGINFLRLYSPNSGFYLVLMDRVDGASRFEKAEGSERLRSFYGAPASPEAILHIHDHFDPLERVRHSAEEFRQHAITVPRSIWFQPPKQFGEMGALCGNYLVNDDVVVIQSRINALHRLGVFQKLKKGIKKRGKCRIVEIGAGTGMQAASFRQILGPDLEYVVIDLPPLLFHSGPYLSRLADFKNSHLLRHGDSWPGKFEFVFLANYLIEEFQEHLGLADLVVNTMSFGEMSEDQVDYYANLAKKILSADGFLYEENCRVLAHHVPVPDIIGRHFGKRTDLPPGLALVRHGCHRLWSNARAPTHSRTANS